MRMRMPFLYCFVRWRKSLRWVLVSYLDLSSFFQFEYCSLLQNVNLVFGSPKRVWYWFWRNLQKEFPKSSGNAFSMYRLKNVFIAINFSSFDHSSSSGNGSSFR